GTHPARDRVTEIAVLEVNGFELAAEWSTLVNPETGIEPGIQALTGISNEMVAAAPRFAALAAELYERLDGRLLIAHNARFDYGFLRREFERAGLKYLSKTLCTVKLSRRLYPEHARHNLDSLIEHHGLACPARHRALADAEALWQFLQLAEREPGELCGFVFDFKRLRLAQAREIDSDTLPFLYGLFRSKRAAHSALRAIADEHRLCLQTLGFDTARQGACFRHQIGRCAGVCAGKENIHQHHARLASELAKLRTAEWRLPSLELLLARGRARSGESQPLERWLAEAFGLEDEPVAAGALTALAGNRDPGEERWVRADPVHLRLMRDRLILVPASAFGLSREEAEALCETLNEHFAGRLDILPVQPQRWSARLQMELEVSASSPFDMAGRELQAPLPGDALLNEAQMVLHEHPVNEAREARGEPAVN